MSVRLNSRDNGLCWYPRLREQQGLKKNKKIKAHVTYGVEAATKVVFGLLLLIALATNITMPKHQTNPNATYTEQVMNRFHEVNEMYDVTLHEVHHLLYPTEISST